jgi:hypothetical protein
MAVQSGQAEQLPGPGPGADYLQAGPVHGLFAPNPGFGVIAVLGYGAVPFAEQRQRAPRLAPQTRVAGGPIATRAIRRARLERAHLQNPVPGKPQSAKTLTRTAFGQSRHCWPR